MSYRYEEEMELTTRVTNRKGISTTLHIEPFKPENTWSSFWCQRCNLGIICIGRFLVYLLFIAIMSGIIFGIFYGGWLVVYEGIKKESYADSFDILMTCIIIRAEEEEYIQESCSTNQDGSQWCFESTEYRTHYDYIIDILLDDVNISDTICINNTEKYTYTINGKPEYSVDEDIDCYTNTDCDNVFWEQNNEHHGTAGWIYFGAAVIFCCDLCAVIGCVWGCVYNFGSKDWPHLKRCCECICCLCCERSDYKVIKIKEKENYYDMKWKRLSKWNQGDYIIGYWIHSGQINPKIVTDNMFRIIIGYYGFMSNNYQFKSWFH